MLSSDCDLCPRRSAVSLKAKFVKHSGVTGLVLLKKPTKLLSCEIVYKQTQKTQGN